MLFYYFFTKIGRKAILVEIVSKALKYKSNNDEYEDRQFGILLSSVKNGEKSVESLPAHNCQSSQFESQIVSSNGLNTNTTKQTQSNNAVFGSFTRLNNTSKNNSNNNSNKNNLLTNNYNYNNNNNNNNTNDNNIVRSSGVSCQQTPISQTSQQSQLSHCSQICTPQRITYPCYYMLPYYQSSVNFNPNLALFASQLRLNRKLEKASCKGKTQETKQFEEKEKNRRANDQFYYTILPYLNSNQNGFVCDTREEEERQQEQHKGRHGNGIGIESNTCGNKSGKRGRRRKSRSCSETCSSSAVASILSNTETETETETEFDWHKSDRSDTSDMSDGARHEVMSKNRQQMRQERQYFHFATHLNTIKTNTNNNSVNNNIRNYCPHTPQIYNTHVTGTNSNMQSQASSSNGTPGNTHLSYYTNLNSMCCVLSLI